MQILKSTTQQHIDIEDINSDLLILKDGSACMILSVSAINFGLLSEGEQEATIFSYAQLLNSLTFSIQIVVASKQKDITLYLKYVDDQIERLTSPLIKDQMVKYRDFVKSVVRQGNVLDKKFYVALPYSSLELGITTAALSLAPRPEGLPKPVSEIVEKATISLDPKRDHLIRLFARIGLKARQLTSPELQNLYFSFYH
jgi:hypothetical protein